MSVEVKELLLNKSITPVVRGSEKETIVKLGHALLEGGIRFLEITAETPKVMNLVEHLVDNFRGELIVGVGTVLDSETARAAILSGAEFIVSPTLNVDVIKTTKRYGKVSIPGALTPTEILTAYENGADAVKVFPAGTLGASYVKDIKGPLPQIPLIVTGGITLDNVAEFIRAGANGVGVGGSLVDKQLILDNDFSEITNRAKQFISKINSL